MQTSQEKDTSYKDRVVEEEKELSEKIEKLSAFFETRTFNGLSLEARTLLSEQRRHMKNYRQVLKARIALFNSVS